MTFSPLTSYSVATRKYNDIGRRSIDRLIVHHTAGGTDAGNIDLLSKSARDVSATYCLLTDAQLVGIVPEEYRPWTSNSPGVDADRNSVTVETVNTSGPPHWYVSDAQVERLAQLAADLSTRYGWGGLDRARVIGHRQVAQTACPGPYLYPLLDHIVTRANQILEGDDMPLSNDDIQKIANAVLDTRINRAGPGQSGTTSLRSVVGWFDISREDTIKRTVGGIMDAPVKRAGTRADGKPQTGITSLGSVIAWFDHGIASILTPINAIRSLLTKSKATKE